MDNYLWLGAAVFVCIATLFINGAMFISMVRQRAEVEHIYNRCLKLVRIFTKQRRRRY